MSSIAHLLAGAALFYGGHVILASAPVRPRLLARLGERGFTLIYSTVALLGLLWLGYGYAHAPRAPWWDGTGLAAVPVVLMAPASLLLVGAFSQSNPTAVGQAKGLAAEARGILRITRHPFLWAVALWGMGHLLVNGDGPSLLLFGGMLLLAVLGSREIDRKAQRRDPAAWTAFAARTSSLPFAAIAAGRNRLVWAEIGWWRLALAAALYALVLALHPHLFGVSPVG